MLGYAMRRTTLEAARDAAAETFAIAWRRLDAVPEREAIPWLLATARNVLANQRRRDTAASGSNLPTWATASQPDVGDTVAGALSLAAAFARLKADDRETLALIAWDGLEPREAAVVVGCSAATFAVRLHRARRRLASFLAEVDDAERRPASPLTEGRG